jgi:hypothetical protein
MPLCNATDMPTSVKVLFYEKFTVRFSMRKTQMNPGDSGIPYIHTIVPAGGSSEDGMEWIPSAKTFFVPVKVLSVVFRGILCRLIHDGICQHQIKLPDNLPDFETLKTKCYANKWVVHAGNPFATPENLIR